MNCRWWSTVGGDDDGANIIRARENGEDELLHDKIGPTTTNKRRSGTYGGCSGEQVLKMKFITKLTNFFRLGVQTRQEVVELNRLAKEKGEKAIVGLDTSQCGIFVDTEGAVRKVAEVIAEEQGISMEDVIQQNCEDMDFWERVKAEGSGLVIEGNSRTRYNRIMNEYMIYL
jgi:hypothetical protein